MWLLEAPKRFKFHARTYDSGAAELSLPTFVRNIVMARNIVRSRDSVFLSEQEYLTLSMKIEDGQAGGK